MLSRYAHPAQLEIVLADGFLTGIFQDAKCTCRRPANLGRFVRISSHSILALANEIFFIPARNPYQN